MDKILQKPKIICTITIDTEPDCDSNWNRKNPLTFMSILDGIPKKLRPLWNKYDVRPSYFISPEILINKKSCEVLREEKKLGAEIGAHLHGEYIEPQKKYEIFDGTKSDEYPCYAYSKEIEFQKIENLTNLIQRIIGIKPVSYRAARFGTDIDTINSLIKLGYKVDTSITPHINWTNQKGPNHSKAPEQPYWISQNDYYKEDKNNKRILEVPITIGNKRFGPLGRLLPDKWFFYNWLRPSLMTFFEQKKLINMYLKKYKEKDIILLNMMFHSMEVIPNASPLSKNRVQSKLLIHRLEKVIKYLISLNCKFSTLKELTSNNNGW